MNGVVPNPAGKYGHAELKLVRRAHSYLRCCAEQDRADVECRAGLVRWQIVDVLTHCEFAGFDEQFGRHGCHVHCFRRLLHAVCVHLRTEDTHLAVHGTIRFQSLKRLLGVLQRGCGCVQRDSRVSCSVGFAPTAVGIMTSDNIIRRRVRKCQVCPINIFHIKTLPQPSPCRGGSEWCYVKCYILYVSGPRSMSASRMLVPLPQYGSKSACINCSVYPIPCSKPSPLRGESEGCPLGLLFSSRLTITSCNPSLRSMSHFVSRS